MKIPQKPPDWLTILKANLDSILNSKNFEMLNEFIRRVERRDEYVNWDKFKYLDIPEDMPPEHAWSYLKLTSFFEGIKSQELHFLALAFLNTISYLYPSNASTSSAGISLSAKSNR